MNQKLKQKILVDLIMIILFATLLFAFQTGLAFHEVAGLCILFLFGLHLYLNWQWVKKVTVRFFKMKAKIKGMFLLNLFLAVGVTVIAGTGILISEVLFPIDWGLDRFVLVSIHRITSYACAGFFALHLAIHARYMVSSVKKIAMQGVGVRGLRRRLTGIAALVVIVAVCMLQLVDIGNNAAGDLVAVAQQVETSAVEDTVSQEISAAADDAAASDTQTSDTESAASVTEDTYIKRDDSDTIADSNATVSEQQADDSTPSLSEYLGNLFCTACHRHCSLLNPQCSKGVEQAQSAEAQYVAQYGEAITAD